MTRLLRAVWWAMRWGVTSSTWRALCRRCGVTGEAHVTGEGCCRFRPLEGPRK